MRDFRRVNVALSRAQDVLAIVGDCEFVTRAEDLGPLQRVLEYMQRKPDGVSITSLSPIGGR